MVIPVVMEINIEKYLNISEDKLHSLGAYLRIYKWFVLFTFLDVVTTAIAIYLGHTESMAFTRFFIEHWGYLGIVMSKGIVLLYLFPTLWGLYDLQPRIGKNVIKLCCLWMIFVAFHNTIIILRGIL